MSSINTVHVLIMDPSSNEAEHFINLLRNFGYAVRATPVSNEQKLEEVLGEQSWDLFISKPEIEGLNAFRALDIIHNYGRDIPFILLAYEYDPDIHLKGVKAGMRDVLPADQQELFCLIVERELKNLDDRRRRRSAEVFLHETEKRNELLLDSSNEAIAYVHEGMHIYANKAYAELFGYENSDDLECMPIMDMINRDEHDDFKQYIKQHAHNDNEEEFAFTGVCDDGSNFDAVMTVSPAKYEGEECTQLLIRTAGNSLELEQKLKELQAKDILTGLYNQSFFVEKVQEQIAKPQEGLHPVIIFAELDQFDDLKRKFTLTDMEDLLKQAAEVLVGFYGEDVLAGRIGEDGFVVLMNYANPNHGKDNAEKLCKVFKENLFELQGKTLNITLSIGVAVKQDNDSSGSEMVSHAHAACIRATSKGGDDVKNYNPAIDSGESQGNVHLLEQLQEAMENDRVQLTFQPIVKLHGEPKAFYQVGMNVYDEENKLIALDEIMPAAQKAGMAIKLERWMVSNAISKLAQNKDSGQNAKLFLPLSAASLLDDKFPHFILECVKRAKLPTANLIFQLNESVAAGHLKRSITFSKAMEKLKCGFAISGFGGSLDTQNLLSHLNIQYATLMEESVSYLLGSEEENSKVHELIDVIHNSSITSIMSKVEDAQALAVLWPLGVHYIQGTYLHEPSTSMDYDFTEGDF